MEELFMDRVVCQVLHTSEVPNKTTEQYPLPLENEKHQHLLQLRGSWISRGAQH